MKTDSASYRCPRFPPEIISHGVWLYHRFCLSFRDVEELLAKCGITVTYETVREWCEAGAKTQLAAEFVDLIESRKSRSVRWGSDEERGFYAMDPGS